jgi:TRAP transporter TAXI family solute receptor
MAIPAAALAAIGASLWPAAGQSAPAGALRLAIGVAEGGPSNRALGDALVAEYARELPQHGLTLVEKSYGAVQTLEALERNETDFGITAADVSYLAYAGRLDGYPGRFDGLRGVAVLDLAPLHLMIRPNASIRTVGDLRGRSVNIGPPGSATRFISEIVLRAFELDSTNVATDGLSFSAAGARLAAGQLDAMFATVADPAEFVRSATRAGARLVPILGPEVDRLRNVYRFLQLAQVPGGIYPGHESSILTIGVEKVLVCRRDLPERVVYDFTNRLFRVLPAVAASLDDTRFSALEHGPATPIPLHPGAARYYRERELFR